MRVLYLVTKSDLGGAQVHILDLLHGFRNVLDPVVAAGEEGYFTEAVRKLGVSCHIVRNLVHEMNPVRDCKALVETARLIRSSGVELVHTHTSKAGVIGRLAARAAGVPSIFTAHTWCFAEGTSWKWRLAGIPAERVAGWFSSAIINVSDANRELAQHHGISDAKRMLTIWNGIPDTIHRARPGHGGVPRVVMVARCVQQKDHALLLAAFAAIERPAKLVFVGGGDLHPALKAQASQLAISERVEFLGERLDIAEILAGAHIFALATKWEGFPLSILEAMRAGLPVIASDVGGVSEAVADGKTGFLIPRGDAERFRERLDLLLSDPSLRRRMGVNARSSYENQFTLEHMLRKTLAVYQMTALGVRAAAVPGFPAAQLPAARIDY
jgi:glycosyltransferase involved in cell wall biosynthesis